MADKDFVVKNGLVVNNNLIVATAGSVGINTASPDATLSVIGTANVSANVTVGANVAAVSGIFSTSVNVGATSLNATAMFVGNSSVNSYQTASAIAFNGVNTLNSTAFAGTANNATFAFGKSEGNLNVNNATTAYGKTEGNLNVNSALTSNNTTFAYGKAESALSVNTALTSNNSTNFAGQPQSYYANVTSPVFSSSVTVGNSTVNVAANSTALSVGNSTSNVILSSTNASALWVTGNAYVSANLTVGGNFNVTGQTVFSGTQVSNGNFTPQVTQIYSLGNTAFRWDGVYANFIDLPIAGYVSVGNSTANSYTTFNQVGVANSTGSVTMTPFGLSTGITAVNSSIVAVGANSVHNSSAFSVGNSTSNSVQTQTSIVFNSNSTVNATINATTYTGTSLLANNATNLGGVAASAYVQNTDSRTLSGNLTFSGTNVGFVLGYSVGANVVVNTSSVSVGNSSVNTMITAAGVTTAGNGNFSNINATSNVNAGTLTVSGNGSFNNVIVTTNTSTGNLSVSGNASITGNVVITGNLIVSGTTVSVNSATLDVKDLNITVAKGALTSTLADGGGLTVDGAGATWNWHDATSSWQSNRAITPSANVNYTLGTAGLRWSEVYSGNVYGTIQTTSQPNITANNSTFFAGQSQSYYANVTSPSFSTSVTVGSVVVNSTAILVGTGIVNSTSFTGTAANSTLLNNKTEGNLNVNSAVTSNNSTFAFGKSESSLNVNSAVNANNATFFNGQAGAFYANVTSPSFSTLINVASGAVIANSSGIYTTGNGSFAKVGINNTSPTVSLTISANDAALLPVGNTAQRPTAANGMIRYNVDTAGFEGYANGAWGAIAGGGGSGGGYYKGGANTVNANGLSNIFRVNYDTLSYNTTIASRENAQATGPLTVAAGITLTVETGGRIAII